MQVVFRQWNHEVQAFPPRRAYEVLAQRIGLGTPDRDFEHLQSQVVYTLVKRLGEDMIPVMDQETVAVMNRHGFAQLLHRP